MKRLVLGVSVLLATSACGAAASLTTSVPDRGAAVGRVLCTADGDTRVLTPRVRARTDGIHLSFVNLGNAAQFYMRSEDDPGNNHGGRIRNKVTKDVSSHGPGEMWVACLDRREDPPPFYEGDARYANFEIVDPDDLWISPKPQCGQTDEARDVKLRDARSVDDLEAWVRDRFDIEGGQRERPGYPDTGWKLPTWVIVDGDSTLAYFVAVKDDGIWHLLITEGCLPED